MRRAVAFEKYRKGVATSTIYPEAEKAKLSDTGK
jgi:pilus assembly protein CpaD